MRALSPLSLAAFCLVGCSAPPSQVRFVPSSTIFRAEPQPTTTGEFREAERQGYLVAATGQGRAFGSDDLPIFLQEGERLHVIRVIPGTSEVLVIRQNGGTLARIDRDGLELRGSTYPDRT